MPYQIFSFFYSFGAEIDTFGWSDYVNGMIKERKNRKKKASYLILEWVLCVVMIQSSIFAAIGNRPLLLICDYVEL